MEPLELVDHGSSPRPFQCDWNSCGKTFKRKSDLRKHYRSHTNERLYACTIPGCSNIYNLHASLTIHIRTHTGKKPYKCQQPGCGWSFSTHSSLARHRRSHSGKRPYKCGQKGCLKTFTRKTNMVNHQRRIHGLAILDNYTSECEIGDGSSTLMQRPNTADNVKQNDFQDTSELPRLDMMRPPSADNQAGLTVIGAPAARSRLSPMTPQSEPATESSGKSSRRSKERATKLPSDPVELYTATGVPRHGPCVPPT